MFRVFIAAISLLALVAFISGWHYAPATMALGLRQFRERLDVGDFAYCMAIACSILAGACATFIAIVASVVMNRHDRAPGAVRHDPSLDDDRVAAIGCLTVAFVAAVTATITFAALYAID
ncbi:MAG: hypothetical protein V1694_08035 [Candidatus Eisenbacteria bacterium]